MSKITFDDTERVFDKCTDEHCKNCPFMRFMTIYGIYLNRENCWINCSDGAIKEDLDNTFTIINSDIKVNDLGYVCYDGNVKDSIFKRGEKPS